MDLLRGKSTSRFRFVYAGVPRSCSRLGGGGQTRHHAGLRLSWEVRKCDHVTQAAQIRATRRVGGR